MVQIILASILFLGVITPPPGFYDAANRPGRSVVSGWSGYQTNVSSASALALQINGIPCVAWEAVGGTHWGSHVAYAHYDKTLDRWVGLADALQFDVVSRLPGFASEPVLVMMAGDNPVTVWVQRPALSGFSPEQVRVARYNIQTHTWEGFLGASPDVVATGTCTSGSCTRLVADAALDPATGELGIVYANDGALKFARLTGGQYVMENITTVGGKMRPALAYELNGTAHVTWGGVSITGQPITVQHGYRVSAGTWRGYSLPFDQFGNGSSSQIAISAAGQVAVSYVEQCCGGLGHLYVNTYAGTWATDWINGTVDDADTSSVAYDTAGLLYAVWYSRTAVEELLLRKNGSIWENMLGGSAPTVVTNDSYANPVPDVVVDAQRRPRITFWLGPAGQFPDVGYTHWLP